MHQGALNLEGTFFAGNGKLFQLFIVIVGQFCNEWFVVVLQIRLDGPVFTGYEFLDFLFAFCNQAQRRALHPSRRQAGTDFSPQQRRQVEADQIVQRATRLLCVYQALGKFSGVCYRFLDSGFGELVELYTVHILVLENVPRLEQLEQMPGNRFTFTIRVGCQVECIGIFQRFGYGIYVFLVAFDHLIVHREVVFRVNSPRLWPQVPDVPIGSQGMEPAAKILADGFRFRG